MKKPNRSPAPGYDVSDYGAKQRVNHFIIERLYTRRLATLKREDEALKKVGYDPNALILVDRIGDTGIFSRVSLTAPILVNENGEIRDLNEQMRKR